MGILKRGRDVGVQQYVVQLIQRFRQVRVRNRIIGLAMRVSAAMKVMEDRRMTGVLSLWMSARSAEFEPVLSVAPLRVSAR